MSEEKFQKLLKKYSIPKNKSADEMIELLEIKCDELLERQNRTKDAQLLAKLGAEIDAINEAIEYIEKNEKALESYVTEIVEEEKREKEDNSKEIAGLKGENKEKPKSVAFDGAGQSTAGGGPGTGGASAGGSQTAVSGSSGGNNQSTSAVNKMWFVSLTGDTTINNLFIQVEDNLKYAQWDLVNRITDQIMMVEPKNPGIYLAKVMARYQVMKVADLATLTDKPVDTDVDMRKAFDYGNSQQAKYIDDMMTERHCRMLYQNACRLVNSNESLKLREAASRFDQIKGYRDADAQAADCRKRADELEKKEQEAKAEAERKAQLTAQADDLKKKFYDISYSDNKARKKALNEIEAYLKDHPDVKTYLTDSDLDNMRAGIKTSVKLGKRTKRQNAVALFLLILSLMMGVVGIRDSSIFYIGVMGYLPVPVGTERSEIYESGTRYVFSLSKLNGLRIEECPNLKYLIVPFADLDYFDLKRGGSMKKLTVPAATEISVRYNDTLREITIPEGVVDVYISNCSELQTVNLPDSVETLKVTDCSKLSEMEILSGVQAEIRNCPMLEGGDLQ